VPEEERGEAQGQEGQHARGEGGVEGG